MSDEKKLHIDEDWKSQVAREKEQFAKKSAIPNAAPSPAVDPSHTQADSNRETASDVATASVLDSQSDSAIDTGTSATKPSQSKANSNQGEADAGRFPPPTLNALVTMLATQAMVSLGQFPSPDNKSLQSDLTLAKHFIDLLGVIEEKTKNNLTSDETQYLGGALYQLRLSYIEASKPK